MDSFREYVKCSRWAGGKLQEGKRDREIQRRGQRKRESREKKREIRNNKLLGFISPFLDTKPESVTACP